MYLADLLREANPSGVIKNEIEKMCIIVESAMMPLQLTSQWSGGQGDPHNEELIGYLFGWLDVFKTQVWQVRDFNRSFFHFGFLLWFGGPLATKEGIDRHRNAMTAMLSLGLGIQTHNPQWTSAARKGREEALDFLAEEKLFVVGDDQVIHVDLQSGRQFLERGDRSSLTACFNIDNLNSIDAGLSGEFRL